MKTIKNRAICRLSWEYGRTGRVELINKKLDHYCFYFDGGGKIGVFKHEFYSFDVHGEQPVGMNPSLFV